MSKNKKTDLPWRDAEDLELFARELRDLSSRSQSYEPSGSPTHETPSFPGFFDSFSSRSASAISRAVHQRLTAASELYAPAAAVLLALHDPASVMCDGKTSLTEEEADRARRDPTFRVREQLDVGRRLGVYPMTWSADEARRWKHAKGWRGAAGRLADGLRALGGGKLAKGVGRPAAWERVAQLLTLDGRRPAELLSLIADAKRSAKGAEADLWRAIDDEAQALIRGSVAAWNEMAPHRVKRVRWRTDRLVAA